MNQIDQPPVATPIPVLRQAVDFRTHFEWSKWFGQIYQALFRPTVTTTLTFASTTAQSSRDIAVAFPKGSVALNDLPVLQTPAPPANTCFTCHIAQVDQVIVRFNNYSSGAVAFGPASFSISVLNQ